MSNVEYVPVNSRFIRGQWRVWCFDIRRGHYWGFQGDEHAVAVRGERRHRKVASCFLSGHPTPVSVERGCQDLTVQSPKTANSP